MPAVLRLQALSTAFLPRTALLLALFAATALPLHAEEAPGASRVTFAVIAEPHAGPEATLPSPETIAQALSRTPGAALAAAYAARDHAPFWLVTDAGGDPALGPAAEKLLAIFENAAAEGLRPGDYLTPTLVGLLSIVDLAHDTSALAALDTTLSAAALRYADHIHNGRIRPADVSANFDIPHKRFDEPAFLASLAAARDPAAVLATLEPAHPEFHALKAALATLGDVAPPPRIADGPLLRLGAADPRVPLIRERLELAALDEPQGFSRTDAVLVYDAALVEAVTGFQASLGLEADGIVGPATIAALNGGAATTREDILANMERWRWMPADLGSFNVFVNIPEFRLAINDGASEAYSTRVVVGTTSNQTPLFSDNIRHIVVNPYWNVPSSIIRGEIIPAVMRNPGYIQSQNMELLYNGSVVSPSQVNWSAVGPNNFPFRVRQRPGPGNALGQIKFLFPNKHDVYLHDTPSKSLFSRSSRAFSHGCVRVENPFEFAEALLAYEPALSRASLEALFGPAERWVNPTRQIPVHLAYFTIRTSEDGSLRSFGDIYGHNQRLIELMAR